MAKEIKYSRFLLKRTDVAGLSATTAPTTDHTILPAWSSTDIYVGELFFNSQDDKLWVRSDNKILEIPLLDGESSLNAFPDVLISNPQDGQLLTYSGGTWVNKTPSTTSGDTLIYSMVSPLMMGLDSPQTDSLRATATLTSPIITETIIKEIDTLTQVKDVLVDNLHNFDILIYRDGKWTNMPVLNIPKRVRVEELTNVEINDVVDDQMLYYQEGKWVNKNPVDKINYLTWDRHESKLLIDTNSGTFQLSIQGKPIQVITESIELDDKYYSIIIDAKRVPINIFLPPCEVSYGHIFKFKVINHTNEIKIIPQEMEFIFTDSLNSQYIVTEENFSTVLTLQCDGDSVWYSI